ncbi:hypothetical protein CY34DRAFT_803189 [Suillus luteus UH-Slu-Lm8-n1]|uniref:Uncharacterized protein n=1 Tax=Suillus luteus UH-Slu-Lm8-n1 TaxID=930992 RepID=A0A0D0BCG3_9AGAM|nr:hypothetical protein CY34DRAFT_803189 [Suillus luteus UH-Slu-Lm8-n1]
MTTIQNSCFSDLQNCRRQRSEISTRQQWCPTNLKGVYKACIPRTTVCDWSRHRDVQRILSQITKLHRNESERLSECSMDGRLDQCYIRSGRVLGCGSYRPSTPPSRSVIRVRFESWPTSSFIRTWGLASTSSVVRLCVVKKLFSINNIYQGFVYFMHTARAQVIVDHLELGAPPFYCQRC